MSKRALKTYLTELDQDSLQEQIIDLYERFPQVKTYYDFVFNPKEDKLVEEAKIKIGKEYFPQNSRKPKKRRSVAQRYIKHFKTLGMDAVLLADVMVFHIEVAQAFTADTRIKQEAFYKSMAKAFQEAIGYIHYEGIQSHFNARLTTIIEQSLHQEWPNAYNFQEIGEDYVVNQ